MDHHVDRHKKITVLVVSCVVLTAARVGLLRPVIIASAVVAGILTGGALLWERPAVRRSARSLIHALERRWNDLWT